MNYFKSLLRSISCFCMLCSGSLAANDIWECYPFYIGVNGGFATGLGKAENSIGVGLISGGANGIASDAECKPGWLVEAKIGYQSLFCIDFELSYTYISSKYNWNASFGVNDGTFASTELFEADLNVHLALVNGYLHLDQLCCSDVALCVSPYIMGGIGAAWNDLGVVNEYGSPITPTAPEIISTIRAKTTSNFAGRFGFGVVSHIANCLTIDTGLYAIYIDTVKTGTTRNFSGDVEDITPYKFKNNWLGSIYFGINYLF